LVGHPPDFQIGSRATDYCARPEQAADGEKESFSLGDPGGGIKSYQWVGVLMVSLRIFPEFYEGTIQKEAIFSSH